MAAIFLTDLAFARPTLNGCPGIIAAYNAGPARYAAYLARRQRLPAETVAYVNAVT